MHVEINYCNPVDVRLILTFNKPNKHTFGHVPAQQF